MEKLEKSKSSPGQDYENVLNLRTIIQAERLPKFSSQDLIVESLKVSNNPGSSLAELICLKIIDNDIANIA